MTAGDLHVRSMVPRGRPRRTGDPALPDAARGLARYFRYVRMLVPVACLLAYAVAEFATAVDPSTALLAWLVAAYVAGMAYEAADVTRRLARQALLRGSLVVDIAIIAGIVGTLDAPELATIAFLWPVLVAARFASGRDVLLVAGAASACVLAVPAVVRSDARPVLWLIGSAALLLFGIALAGMATRGRVVERELVRERALEDIVLRFTERARDGASLEPALRMLELDLRAEFGASHAWIDLARTDRTRRAMPGATVVPVIWDGEFVARITVANADGVPVDTELLPALERVGTFVAAVVGQVDSLRRHDEAKATMLEADRLKGRFLAMASHELRTPLTSIRGFSETISRQWDVLPDEDKQRFLAIVVSQSERLARLVDDVLLLSGIQSGRLELHPMPVRLATAAEAAVEELGIDGVLVDCDEGLRAVADPDHVARMLCELLSNASRHGAAPIVVTCESVDADVVLTVADAGPGIDEEFVPRLFDEFQRDRGAANRSGTGLGLSIVRTLARAHGGEAWYEPNDPAGSRFRMRLPAVPSTISGAAPAAAGHGA